MSVHYYINGSLWDILSLREGWLGKLREGILGSLDMLDHELAKTSHLESRKKKLAAF